MRIISPSSTSRSSIASLPSAETLPQTHLTGIGARSIRVLQEGKP